MIQSTSIVVIVFTMLAFRFGVALHRARMKFKQLKANGIPIMKHSYLFGHLGVVRDFYNDWASDANFIQTFGYYMSKHWRKFLPDETHLPPVVYIDVWPIATPMAFSMEAYVSNQIELGKSLPKSPMQGEFLRPISNGRDLNCMHGEEWRMWRGRFNPGFSKENIRKWVPAIVEEVESFVQVLRDRSGVDGKWGSVFQLEKISGDLAFDATGRIVVDKRFQSLSSSPGLFSVLYRQQLQNMEITLNVFKLMWRATPVFRWLTGRRRQELFKQLRPFIVESLTDDSVVEPPTIVRSAVKEYAQEIGNTQVKGADKLDEEFVEKVFCQLMIFFFGGEDAVSTIIPWMMYRLETNSKCLVDLRAEHDRLLGPDPEIALAKIRESPHLLDSLQYSHAIIKETLRLNPATITIREGQPDFTMQIAGSDVSWPTQGFDLFDSSITIHRDPANFPEPLKFIPERFTVPEEHELHPPKNTWRGFQLGPRKCIGQEMAIVLLKLVLVAVVRTFDIELAWDEWDAACERNGTSSVRHLVEGERMYTTGKATSHPKDGAPVHVRLRNK